jgi:hypothetical protein
LGGGLRTSVQEKDPIAVTQAKAPKSHDEQATAKQIHTAGA